MPSEMGPDSPAVSARGLRKKYRLFTSQADRLKEAFHPFRRQFHREFWALNGVSFDLPKGRTLGILGANGSGKSTLLQVIAGILHPTSGSVTIEGRVAALLELGAGFNPEFTGRDNVILNGAINGISGREITRRLPEIEEFADIGEFFDQPVKTYSSGMFVRVAFAVAINVDPDILIIDEALAVGDARFQNKCYDRLARFQKDGKTIILVTHDTRAVANHCDLALVMDHGANVFFGHPLRAIDLYYDLLYPAHGTTRLADAGAAVNPAGKAPRSGISSAEEAFWNAGLREDRCPGHPSYNAHERRIGHRSAEIIDHLLLSEAGADEQSFPSGTRLRLLVKVMPTQDVPKFLAGFSIKTIDGVEIYGTHTGSSLLDVPQSLAAGQIYFCEFVFEQNLLPGDYFVDVGLAEDDGTPSGSVIEVRRSLLHFTVIPSERSRFTGMVDFRAQFVSHSPAHRFASRV
jgi:lipopolysaccharide transport system ATP-binding protein